MSSSPPKMLICSLDSIVTATLKWQGIFWYSKQTVEKDNRAVFMWRRTRRIFVSDFSLSGKMGYWLPAIRITSGIIRFQHNRKTNNFRFRVSSVIFHMGLTIGTKGFVCSKPINMSLPGFASRIALACIIEQR